MVSLDGFIINEINYRFESSFCMFTTWRLYDMEKKWCKFDCINSDF